MNGAQDLGGTHGHGPVTPEPNEPVFHAEWEKRAFPLTLAMGMPGGWNIDMGRFARENRPPAEYLSMSYYQIWFAALEHMIKERGLVSEDEIDARAFPHTPEAGQAHHLSPGDVAKCFTAAVRPSAIQKRRRSSNPATRYAQRTSIRSPTRGCRAMCAAMSAPSNVWSVAMFFPTATRPVPAKIRSGSIRYASMGVSFGAPMAMRR